MTRAELTPVKRVWLCQMTFALQAKPVCGVLGAEAIHDKGSWHRETASGHLFWEPSQCRLRRMTAQEARSCLAGRNIAFVGDSVSRRASPPSPLMLMWRALDLSLLTEACHR